MIWDSLIEASSTISTLKNITPSNRSDVSSTQGIGDRSDIGKKPVDGQKSIWANLDGQSRGMVGELDTQGKKEPELYTSHKGNSQSNDPGTCTPTQYKDVYKATINESSNGGETGVGAGKHKHSAAAGEHNTGMGDKYVQGGDTKSGGSCNCGCTKKSVMTEQQLIGSTVALVAIKAFHEACKVSDN